MRFIIDRMEKKQPGKVLYRWLSLLLLVAVAVFAVAVYGARYFQDGRTDQVDVKRARPLDTSTDQQDARIPIGSRPSWKEMDDPAKDG